MKTTESDSLYNDLEKKSIGELLIGINNEDKKVAEVVGQSLNQIEDLIRAAYNKMKDGGRLFYLGSGTSGRLGILDASECPPTFGVNKNLVIGLIAGGDTAIRTAVEKAEDEFDGGWKDLQKYNVCEKDFVIGISSSGMTPYVIGALQNCSNHNIETGCITSNDNSQLSKEAIYPVEVIVGPEFVTGSTRMKSGTAQKMVLNMITTTLMIKLGKVLGNKMVDMQLNNEKLIDRGSKMIVDALGIPYNKAKEQLLQHGSVRSVLKKSK